MAVGRIFPILPSSDPSGNKGRRVTVSDDPSGDLFHESSSEISTDTLSPIPWRFLDYITLNFHNRHTSPVSVEIGWGDSIGSPANLIIEVPPGLPPISLPDTLFLTGGAELWLRASVDGVISVGHRIERAQVAA